MVPAVCKRVGMLGQIRLHRRAVQLPEDGVEVLLRLLFLLLGRQGIVLCVRLMRDVGIDVCNVGIRIRRGVRSGGVGLLAPGGAGLHADRRGSDKAVFIPHLVDDVLGDEIGRQPLVAHGVHCGVDVNRPPFFDEAVVCIYAEEVQRFKAEDDEQPDGKRLQGLLDLLLFRPSGALCYARAAGRAEQFDL